MKKAIQSNSLSLSIFLSYSSLFFSVIFNIILTPYILEIVGIDNYGTYNIALSIVSFIGLINFGLSFSYTNFYFKIKKVNENLIPSLNSLYFLLFSLLSVISLFIAFFISFYSNYIFRTSLSNSEIQLLSSLIGKEVRHHWFKFEICFTTTAVINIL
jgi:O-antigen/teichoic acid export membrane protein